MESSRPWQEPDEPTILGNAWKRKALANPQIAESLGQMSDAEWSSFAREQAKLGRFPDLKPNERIELGAGHDESLIRGLRAYHGMNTVQGFGAWASGRETDPKVQALLSLRIAGDLGDAEAKQGYADYRGSLTEEQAKRLSYLEGEWDGPRGDYYRKSPAAVSEMLQAGKREDAIGRIYAKGKSPALRQAADFVRPADPKLADHLMRQAITLDQASIKREVYGVGIGVTEGGNEYAMMLGYANGPRWSDLTPSSKERGTQLAQSLYKRLEDEGIPWSDAGEKSARYIEGEGEVTWGRALEAGNETAVQRFFRSPEAQELVRRSVGEEKAAQAHEVLNQVGPEILGTMMVGIGDALSEVRAERPELIDGDPKALAQEMAARMESGPNPALAAIFDVVTRGTKFAGGLMSVGEQYGITGYLFTDGTVLTDPLEAFEKYQSDIEMGKQPGMAPEFEAAVRERRRSLGLDKGEILPDFFATHGPIEAAGMGLEALGNAVDPSKGGVELGTRAYAMPMPIVDRVDEKSWSEAWRDARAGLLAGKGEMVADLYSGMASLGFQEKRGGWDGLILDILSSPDTYLSFGSTVTARGAAKAAKRIGAVADVSPVVKAGAEEIVPKLAKGRGQEMFPTIGQMSEEFAGAHKLLSKRLGGGADAELLSSFLLEKVATDPLAMKKGMKQVMLDNFEMTASLLGRAGDGRVIQAQRSAMERFAKAGRNIEDPAVIFEANRQGLYVGAKAALDEMLPDLQGIISGLESAVARPRWGKIPMPGERTLEEAIRQGAHLGGSGVKWGPLTIPVTPALRKAADGLEKINDAVRRGFKLTKKEQALTSRLSTLPRWVASVFSPTHVGLQKGLGSAYMPLYQRRLANLTYHHSHAQMTSKVGYIITEGLMDAMGEGWIISGARRTADERLASYMLEAGKGASDDVVFDYLKLHRNTIPGVKGMTEAQLRNTVARLRPLREQAESFFGEMFQVETAQGLHKEAVSGGYVPHVFYTRKEKPKAPSKSLQAGDQQGVAKGDRKVSSQLERESFESLVEAAQAGLRPGVDFEDNLFALMYQRRMDHEIAHAANNAIEQLSRSVGVPAIRGQRALMSAMGDSGEAHWSAIGRPLTTLEQRAEYEALMGDLGKAVADSRKFDGLEKAVGLNRQQLLGPDAGEQLLESKAFRHLLYKKHPLIRDLIPDAATRKELGKALKARPKDAKYVFRRVADAAGIKQKKWYHGTGTTGLTADTIDPGLTRIEGLFGAGLYLTDNPAVAESYAKARGKSAGVVYEAALGDAKVLDLEGRLDQSFYAALEKAFGGEYGIGEFWDDVAEVAGKGSATNQEVYAALSRAVENYSHAEGVSSDALTELFQEFGIHMIAAGWDAMTHTGGIRVGGMGKHNVVILIDPSGFLSGSSRRPLRSLSPRATARLSDDLLKAISDGAHSVARSVAAADGTVRKLAGDLAVVTGRDKLDVREARRRLAYRGAPVEEITAKLMDEGVAPAEAMSYQQAAEMAEDVGLTGELLGTLLWDTYGVTRLSELPLRDALALVRTDGPLGRLEAIAGKPIRAVDGRLAPPKRSVMPLLKKVGISAEPSKFDDAYQRLLKLEQQAAEGDAEAAVRLGRLTPRQRQKIEEATSANTYYEGAGAPGIGETFDSLEAKEFHENYVSAMSGGTPLADELRDLYVPADLAIAIRTMMNEAVGSRAAKNAQLMTVGVWGAAVDTMSRMWKSVVTESAFGPAFAMRNKIDGMKAALHIMGMESLSPAFRRELEGLLDGSRQGTQTASGYLTREEFLSGLEQLQTSVAGRYDLTQMARTEAKRRAKEAQRFKEKALHEMVLANRGFDRNSGKLEAKVFWREHRKELGAGVIGALFGGALAGEEGAAIGGVGGFSLTKMARSLRRGGPPGVGGRAMPTTRESILPLHGSGTEVNENYYRAMVWLYHRKRGLSHNEGISMTLKQMRDYSNYSQAERKFLAALPILFYNFAKQNTIAQVVRLKERPGFLSWQAKFLAALNDETPEDMRPAWMSQLNTALIGGKAWMISDELTAPFELISTIQTGKGSDLLMPIAQEAIRSFNGRSTMGQIPQSLAKSLYEKYGAVNSPFIEIVPTKEGYVNAKVKGLGAWMLMGIGMETVMRNAGRVSDAISKDHWVQVGLQVYPSIKAYDAKHPLSESLQMDGLYDKEMAKWAGITEGLMWDRKALQFMAVSRWGMDADHRAIMERLASELNGKVAKGAVRDLIRAYRFAEERATKEEAAVVK